MLSLMLSAFGARIEYAFDHSISNGIDGTIVITDTLSYTTDFDLDLSNLAYGLHHVFFQAVANERGKSMPYIRCFFKTSDNDILYQINKIEYFTDVDPGIGNGTILDVTPGLNVQQTITADLSTASIGMHFMGVRAHTTEGKWSHTIWHQFFTLGNPDLPDLNSICWYFTGPGVDENQVYQIELSPDTNAIENIVIPITHLVQDESYYLHVYGKSDNNRRSLEQVYPFTVNWIPREFSFQINPPNLIISWEPILGADYYKVLRAETCYGEYNYVDTVFGPQWTDPLQNMRFFKVISGCNLP